MSERKWYSPTFSTYHKTRITVLGKEFKASKHFYDITVSESVRTDLLFAYNNFCKFTGNNISLLKIVIVQNLSWSRMFILLGN